MFLYSTLNKPTCRLLAILCGGLLSLSFLWPGPLYAGDTSGSKRQKTEVSVKKYSSKNKG
jgi:hypothetical protein